jgi:DNA-binding response OmpR family regulator
MSHKVLLVEDDAMMQRIIKTALVREGFTVDTAINGKAAMEILLASNYQYDLLIADIMMPYITGFELVNHVKRSENGNNIAVIIISSLNNEESVLQGFELGADDYIKKPLIPSELIVRVKRLLFPKKRN